MHRDKISIPVRRGDDRVNSTTKRMSRRKRGVQKRRTRLRAGHNDNRKWSFTRSRKRGGRRGEEETSWNLRGKTNRQPTSEEKDNK